MDINLNNILFKLTNSLADFLGKILPGCGEDWWNKTVLEVLSYQQKQRIDQQNIKSLAALDIAALLRVMDQNWYQLSSRYNWLQENRHYLKEMQTVRNRWAHQSGEGFLTEDIYRDADTAQRFAAVIGADESMIEEIRVYKLNLLNKANPPKSEVVEVIGVSENSSGFKPGQLVKVRSNPDLQGAVMSVISGTPEDRYDVFLSTGRKTFYESQLINAEKPESELELLKSECFHAYISSQQIIHPGLSTLHSLNAARIDFIPYQFRPVLKFIKADRPRMLIADGVGVGKTIEAGLILREIQARRDIQSVLIICPRPLVTEQKWLKEMKRFDERFIQLDGPALKNCINEMHLEGVWPDHSRKIIVPYSLFDDTLINGTEPGGRQRGRSRTGLLGLDPPPRFDLVIVDEAHHIRNQSTFGHKAVSFFCDHAEAVIFLTATPIQLGSEDLFVLLNILRPDLIIDKESFAHMAEPNPFINRAVSFARAQGPQWSERAVEALDGALATSWGRSIMADNPEFNRVRSVIASGNISYEDRVRLISDLEGLHTFSGIINRTLRRDIGNFTVRRPETVVVEFTAAQRNIHDELLNIQSEILGLLHNDKNIVFMMTTIRRQAASCLFGLVPFLEDILNRHIDELALTEAGSEDAVIPNEAINIIESRIRALIEAAGKLDKNDPKLEALVKLIADKQIMPNKKIMIFSSFRHTLNYLYDDLRRSGYRVGMVHGGTPDEDRIKYRERFENGSDGEDGLDILLFSEIGCEGLDYQFCDCIVNYDLPWNPMRIEQRIGRIDRNGQKSESVVIYNMITPGTVDADIYERCLLRIGVFNNSLGAGEEILGDITTEIRNIAENFSLNDEQRRQKFQQLADNKIRLIQEQDMLEQKQLELFGIRLPEDQLKKEIEDASSFWLSQASIRRLVTFYLQQLCEKESDFLLGEKPLKTLRLSQDARNALLRDFQKLSRQNSPMYRDWENWLKGTSPHLSVTFDPECAINNPGSAFIMSLHPLVKQAANALNTGKKVYTKLRVKSREVPAGKYLFAIYQWQFHGIKEDLILRPVTKSEALTANLMQMLEKANTYDSDDLADTDSGVWDELDGQHYKLWSEARSKHKQVTKELASYRKESLDRSHAARMALLNEQLERANDDKIRRMRQSQIDAAAADYARRVQQIEIAAERADITSGQVAFGYIYVEEQ